MEQYGGKPRGLADFVAFISVIALMASSVAAQDKIETNVGTPEIYEGLVLTVGRGTFAVLCVSLFSVIMCFFKDAFNMPTCCVIVATLLPIITYLIILSIPLKSTTNDKERKDQLPTDAYFVRTMIFFILFIVCCCSIACFSFFSDKSMTRVGRRVDSAPQADIKKAKGSEALELAQRTDQADLEVQRVVERNADEEDY